MSEETGVDVDAPRKLREKIKEPIKFEQLQSLDIKSVSMISFKTLFSVHTQNKNFEMLCVLFSKAELFFFSIKSFLKN